jgi:hypothetical protein
VKQLLAGRLAVVAIGLMALTNVGGELRAEEHPGDGQAGRMLQQLQQAIEQPELEISQQVVVRYGSDQRYYLMIRGWLNERLQGLESQLGTQGDNTERVQQLQVRIEALRGLIRRIDLE